MIKQPFLNTYANNVTLEETIQQIENLISIGVPSYIVAINVDVVMKIENDKYLKKITDEADMVLIDGQPLMWIANYYKRPLTEKVSGSDLVPELCKVANKKGYSIFIVGGREGVAATAKKNLEKLHKNINIVGTYCPPFGFENDSTEIEKMNKEISKQKPDMVFACLGCPKQEKWVYENYKKYNAKVTVCAGATVDFLAGNVKRAPKWMSNCGLEWLYRFSKEPKRLFRRYFIDDIKILKLARKYK